MVLRINLTSKEKHCRFPLQLSFAIIWIYLEMTVDSIFSVTTSFNKEEPSHVSSVPQFRIASASPDFRSAG